MSDLATDPNAEEVRVAMALNGGVSLAVWMGGCGVELDAARRAHVEGERKVYTALCEAFRRVLVLDVMSGASAGGINGALLAAAIVNGRRLEPEFVRSQWLRLGDFSKLLQPASIGDPTSLLQGKWFREQLGDTFKTLIEGEAAPVAKGEVLLDITTTDVAGRPVRFRDFWGQELNALEYRARFRFRAEGEFTHERLADASRSSASFPVAFEPFHVDGALAGLPGRRWVMDGGLLDNAPIRAAIDLIPGRNAWRQVRRYVCYVNAEPPSIVEPKAGQPSLGAIAGDVISLPRKAPFVDQLRAVEDATRGSLLADHEPAPALFARDLVELEAVAEALLPAYCMRRRLESLDELIDDPAEVTEMVRETPELPLPWIPTSLAAREGERWQWGIRPAQRAIQLLLDALRRAVAHADAAGRLELFAVRQRVGEEYARLDTHRTRACDANNRFAAALAEVELVKPWPILKAAWEATSGVVGLLEERDRLTLFGAPFEAFVRRALALEVILRAGGNAPEIPTGQELRFVQLTPEAPTPLLLSKFGKAEPGKPREKLLGLRLAHFGGFYRGSWRVNDFMWGRLDAAARIVEMLVAPGRVQQLARDGWTGEPPWTVLARALTEGVHPLQLKLVEEAVGDVAGLEAALKEDLTRTEEPRGALTRFVCTRAAQMEVLLDECEPLQKAFAVDEELGAGVTTLDFGTPEQALASLRGSKTMPERLCADDEAVSALALRQSAQAGLVALAALRTAKVPLAGTLFGLRALILPIGGSVARKWVLRAGVALAFWAAALVMSSRIVQTSPDEQSLTISGEWALYLALAVVALLVIAGTLLVPTLRVLRGSNNLLLEALKVLALLVTGVAGAVLSAWLIAGAGVSQLVGAPGATLPGWVVATVLAIVLGTPLTIVPALLRGKLGDVLEKPYAGWPALLAFAVASVLAGVASVVQMWDQLSGETWQVIAGWLGLVGAPAAAIVCLQLWKFKSAPLAADGLRDLGTTVDPEFSE